MIFSNVPRIRLLDDMTPMHKIENVGRDLGHDHLYLKREDLMSIGMGGNKLRSLEFWIGEAIATKSDVLLVQGMPQSNQCRLAAVAAAKCGMKCVIFHNATEPKQYNGNILLNKILGTETHFVGKIPETERTKLLLEHKAKLESEGQRPYVIGDPYVGALGYVNAAFEILHQAEQQHIDLKHVFICGSAGPTEAGLAFGFSLFGKSIKMHMITVEYDIPKLKCIISDIFDHLEKRLEVKRQADIDDFVAFYDEYLGGGYEKSTPESIAAIKYLAAKEGIFIEDVYNSKVFGGMTDILRKKIIPTDEPVCCAIAGGTTALFGQTQLF